jgi:hypothetical protein
MFVCIVYTMSCTATTSKVPGVMSGYTNLVVHGHNAKYGSVQNHFSWVVLILDSPAATRSASWTRSRPNTSRYYFKNTCSVYSPQFTISTQTPKQQGPSQPKPQNNKDHPSPRPLEIDRFAQDTERHVNKRVLEGLSGRGPVCSMKI